MQQAVDVATIASRSFEFMTKLFRDVGNLIILIVLNVVPIVNFIVLGYFVQVVRLDLEDPPKLERYGELFFEGLKLILAFLVYAIVPAVLVAISGGAAIATLFTPWGFLRPAAVLLMAVAILILLAALFLGLPAIAIYMRTGDFWKVLDVRDAWDLVQRFGLGNYVVLYVLLMVFGFAAYAVGSALTWVGVAILGVFALAFTFKALSLFVNVKYPPPPPPPR